MEKKILTNGKIESIFGPMYAGKTSELLKRILWLKHQNLEILVIKPKIDNRYSDDEIVTHTGHRFPCVYTNKLMDLLEVNPILNRQMPKIMLNHTIFIDEVQFFEIEDLKEFVKILQNNGNCIVSAGLDQDSSGVPFDSSAYMLAISDEVTKIKSFCSVCGQPATKTYKISNSGNRVEVASVGVYEPRCLEHWKPVR
jgi:thymidine kinase